MSGLFNGIRLMNGTAYDGQRGQRVLADHRTPVDDLEPLPPARPGTPVQWAAIDVILGREGRPYADIGADLGVSAKAICRAVRLAADRLGWRSPREDRRGSCSEAAKRRHRKKKDPGGSQSPGSPEPLANTQTSHPQK